jgi:hypothetical protein
MLGGAAVAAPAVVVAAETVTPKALVDPKLEGWQDGNGWRIRWTGWKGNMSTNDLAAQYVAYKMLPDGKQDYCWPMIYAASGGDVDTFGLGYVFDISQKPGVPWITHFSTEEEKAEAQRLCAERLEKFLNEKVLKVDWHRPRKLEWYGKEAELYPICYLNHRGFPATSPWTVLANT